MLDKEQNTHTCSRKKSNFFSNNFSNRCKNTLPKAGLSAWVWKIGPDVLRVMSYRQSDSVN